MKNKQPGTDRAWEAAQRGGMARQAGSGQPKREPERGSALPLDPWTNLLRMITTLDRTVTNVSLRNTPLSLIRVQPRLSHPFQVLCTLRVQDLNSGIP